MDSNEKNLDNSLEGAMNMTQEEIERFLAQQESQGSNEQYGFNDADLASLLSELGEEEDSDIQEISNLLNRADNNEAVADDVVALMHQQEAEGENAYDAMDLFSGEQAEKKEGFFKRLINKFKKNKKEKPEETTPSEEKQDWEKIREDSSSEDNMAEALALLGGGTDTLGEAAEEAKEEKASKKKKEKKPKKSKKEQKPKTQDAPVEGGEEQIPEKASKKKKDKKVKEKKVKEKKPKDEPIREKKPVENPVELLEEDEQEPPHKKKIIMVFVAAVMIMLGFLVVNHYFTAHANKQLAEEAYEAEDYLECYQLLYGQKLNDSQTVMFHRSELILKMNIFWNHYQEFVANNQLLESLDKLVQFVYEYPSLSSYAAEWNCQDTVEDTYNDVLNILSENYQVSEQEVLGIATLEDDVEYTRALKNLVEEKQKNDAINQAYPDILPEEQDRITQN